MGFLFFFLNGILLIARSAVLSLACYWRGDSTFPHPHLKLFLTHCIGNDFTVAHGLKKSLCFYLRRSVTGWRCTADTILLVRR